MTSTATITRSAVWSSLEAVCTAGLQVVSLVVLARMLGPSDLGLAMLAIAVIYTLSGFIEFFFVEAIVQRESLDDAHVSSAFWVAMAGAGAVIALCLVGADRVALAFGEPELGPPVRWMSPVLAFAAFNGTVMAVLRRSMEFKAIAVGSLAGRVLASTIAIWMAWSGFGVWSVVAQQLALFGGTTAVFWLIVPWRPTLRFSWRHLGELTSFAGPKALGTALASVNGQVLSLLAGSIFGTIGLGYVSLARRVSGTLGNVIDGAARQINLSVFSRQQNSRATLLASVYGSTNVTCLLAFPVFAGLIVCAEDAVALAFGPEWRAAVPLVQLFAVGCILRTTIGPIRTTVEAVGRPALHLIRGFVELIATVVGLLALGSMGPIATGIVMVMVSALTLPIDFAMSAKFLRLSGRVLFQQVRWPLVASTLMACVLMGPQLTFMSTWLPVARLLALVPLGALVYVGLLWMLDRQLVLDTVEGLLAGLGRSSGQGRPTQRGILPAGARVAAE